MRKLLDYIRNSSAVLMIQFNPLAWWVCHYDFESFSEIYPGKFNFNLRVLMFRLSIQLDDGSY